ncbi:MAG: phosphate acyltransferase PlsX [Chloroflexota bacterium]|nr:phosphate acyltransferase PlsX [Chloroflexota bacterium]
MATEKKVTHIAIDAMGGDYAPAEIVAGAIMAAEESDVYLSLVGEYEQVKSELSKHASKNLPIQIVPSDGVVAEDEQPALALRQKPKSSIMVATGMVKQGMADGCVSMGSTGAAMASAAVLLGVIKGIDRPAIGGPVVGLAPNTIVLDVGSNVDCKPSQLVSFAVIGDVFARQVLKIDQPRIGLLSVGAESGKGNKQVKETTSLLENTNLRFVGNVEANDILHDKADVVICDGFVGNVVMKLSEGIGSAFSNKIRTMLSSQLPERYKNEIDRISKEIYDLSNPAESSGGGPIFGVNGVSVVGHGRAKANSLKQAVNIAKSAVDTKLVEKINEELGGISKASSR